MRAHPAVQGLAMAVLIAVADASAQVPATAQSPERESTGHPSSGPTARRATASLVAVMDHWRSRFVGHHPTSPASPPDIRGYFRPKRSTASSTDANASRAMAVPICRFGVMRSCDLGRPPREKPSTQRFGDSWSSWTLSSVEWDSEWQERSDGVSQSAGVLLILAAHWACQSRRGRSVHRNRTTTLANTYRTHCASCHGQTGRGDGPAASTFQKPLPDLATLSSRAGGQFPRAEVTRIIDGRQRTHAPGDMPAWGRVMQSLEGDDRVAQQRIEAVVTYLESIQRKNDE